MREVEIAERAERYIPVRAIPKNYLIISYGVVAFLLIFTLLDHNKFFLFLFLTLFSTIINYHTNMTTIRLNPAPEVFSALLISKVMGFNYALTMLLIPTLFIDFYTARLDADTFVSLMLTVIASFFIGKIMISSFVFTALILITLKFIIGLANDILPALKRGISS